MRKGRQRRAKFILLAAALAALLFLVVAVALGNARSTGNESASPPPTEDSGFHGFLWGLVALVIVVSLMASGALMWENYVRSWQRRQAARAAQAYSDLPPQEKIRYALRQIYNIVQQVDPNGLLEVQIFEKEKWQPILSSQTLLFFARRSETHEWIVDSHDDKSAVVSMRLQRVPVSPILNREFQGVIPDVQPSTVSDGQT